MCSSSDAVLLVSQLLEHHASSISVMSNLSDAEALPMLKGQQTPKWRAGDRDDVLGTQT